MSWDSLMPFNCREFTVEYSRCLSFRMVSTAATSLTDVPAPPKRRTEGTVRDDGGAHAIAANEMTNTHVRLTGTGAPDSCRQIEHQVARASPSGSAADSNTQRRPR